VIVPLRPDHAAELAALLAAERAFLAPYEPDRPASFTTEAGQRERIATALERHERDAEYRWVIVDDGAIAGEIGLSNVVRGPLQSANVGYWVARARNGRGLATAALCDAACWAFETGLLHRLEAGTLLENVRSQHVLARAGFTPIGISPRHLRIAGAWRDHALFARTVEDAAEPVADVEARVAALVGVCGGPPTCG
jgi:ribosomal-protein-alanine N-acetyltransferase